MINSIVLVLNLLGGILLGLFFFGGLCWTVQKSLSATQPALWFLISGLLRNSIALTGFYLLAEHDWQRLLASLIGFILARFLIIKITTQEKTHAPES